MSVSRSCLPLVILLTICPACEDPPELVEMVTAPIITEPKAFRCLAVQPARICARLDPIAARAEVRENGRLVNWPPDPASTPDTPCWTIPALSHTDVHRLQVVAYTSFQRMASRVVDVSLDIDYPQIETAFEGSMHVEHMRRIHWTRVPIASAYELEMADNPAFVHQPELLGRRWYQATTQETYLDPPLDLVPGDWYMRVRNVSTLCEPHVWSPATSARLLRYESPRNDAFCPYCRGIESKNGTIYVVSNTQGIGSLMTGVRLYRIDPADAPFVGSWGIPDHLSSRRLDDISQASPTTMMVTSSDTGLVHVFDIATGFRTVSCGEGPVSESGQNYHGLAWDRTRNEILVVHRGRSAFRELRTECSVEGLFSPPGVFSRDNTSGYLLGWGVAARDSRIYFISRGQDLNINLNQVTVLDRDHNRILDFPDVRSPFASALPDPTGVEVDAYGNVIVVEGACRCLKIFTTEGIWLRSAFASTLLLSQPWAVTATVDPISLTPLLFVSNNDARGAVVRFTAQPY